jgi:hypothetical protein
MEHLRSLHSGIRPPSQRRSVHPLAMLLVPLTLVAVPDLAWAADPIATSDGDISGARVEVTELKRSSGDTLTLKFMIINEGSDPIAFDYEFADEQMSSDISSVGGVYLIDAANKKKYLVVRDSDDNCVCSRDVAEIDAGGQASLWAKFAAPPKDVQAISVIIPHFIPMDDVPIGQ